MVHQRNSGRDPVLRTLLLGLIIAGVAAVVASMMQQTPQTGKLVFPEGQNAGDVVAVKCPFRMPRFSTAQCYRAYVPQDWGANDGPLISILAVKIDPAGGARVSDPFLYLEGGPGYAGVPTNYHDYGASGWLREQYTEVLATGRAMIFVDTRGLGHAEPALHCPEALRIAWQGLKNRPETRDQDGVLAADIACFDQLQAGGVDLEAYHSDYAARDLQALRRGLGIDQWNLYGISYGAQTALNLLNVDRAGVRSLVFDSPSYSRIAAFPADQQAFERVLDQIEERCAAATQESWIERCGDSVKERIATLQDQLRDNPITLRGYPFGKPLYMGDREAMLVFHDVLYSADGFATLLAALAAMEERPTGYFASLSDWAMDWRERIYWSYQDDQFSWPVHLATACREMDHGPSAGQSRWPVYTLDEEQYQRALCAAMDVRWDGRHIDASDFDGVPTLVLSGEKDVITPPQYGRALADDIGADYFRHPRESHGVMFWTDDECVYESAVDFIETLEFDLKDGCSEGSKS